MNTLTFKSNPLLLTAAGAVLLAGGALLGLGAGLNLLYQRWSDPYGYAHGYLILVMCAWMIWEQIKKQDLPVQTGYSKLGFAALALITLGYSVCQIVNFTIGMQFLLPMVILSVVYAIWGFALARVLAAPILFLYFAVPIWDLTIKPLQIAATFVSTNVVQLFDIVAYIEGNVIATANGSFEVGEACAGQRFFTVALAIFTFYGLAFLTSWKRRLWLVMLAVVFAMFSNWVRVVALILVGHHTEMQHYLIQEEHYTFGWIVFVVIMAPLFLIAGKLEKAESAERTNASPDERPAAQRRLQLNSHPFPMLVAAALLAIPYAFVTEAREVTTVYHSWLSEGSTRELTPSDWHPDILPPDSLIFSSVPHYSEVIDVLIAHYSKQHQDGKVASPRNRLQGEGTILSNRLVTDQGMTFQETVTSSGGERRVILSWYYVGGYRVADLRLAKIFEVFSLLKMRREGAIVSISAVCASSCDKTRTILLMFIRSFEPKIEEFSNNGTLDARTN